MTYKQLLDEISKFNSDQLKHDVQFRVYDYDNNNWSYRDIKKIYHVKDIYTVGEPIVPVLQGYE